MTVLFVGLGAIGQRHARNLRALLGPQARFVAHRVRGLQQVVTPTLEADASLDVEREYGITAFDRLSDALATRPAFAVIANPTSMHVGAALECARAGCDLFIEKPLANVADGIAELEAAVRAGGRIAMIAYQMRFHPIFERLRDIVSSGVLGNLLSVRATVGEHLPDWHRYEDYRHMYAARADLGGGVALTQIHEYDYLYALFGMPRRIFALGGHWSRLEIDVEDTVSALLECRWNDRPLPVHVAQDYLQRPASRTCEVIGDRGKAVADFAARTLTQWAADGGERTLRVEFDRNALYLREMEHFLACVADRRRPVVDIEDGRASLEIALGAKRSIETASVVETGPVSAHVA